MASRQRTSASDCGHLFVDHRGVCRRPAMQLADMCCARARVAVPAGMWPRPRQPSDSAPSGGPSRAASEWSHPSPGRIDHHPPAAIGRPRPRHIAHRPLHTSSVPLSPARITCHHTRQHRSHHHRRTHCPPFAVALFTAISCLVCPIAASGKCTATYLLLISFTFCRVSQFQWNFHQLPPGLVCTGMHCALSLAN